MRNFDGFYKGIDLGGWISQWHFLSWRPIRTEKPDFHRPEFFGEVTFEK